jgi:anti-sigma-K factor RskA
MKTNGTQIDGSGTGGLNSPSGKEEAEWAALRYVLAEMSADEAEAFERTLPSDAEGCERVAAAAGLATDLYRVLAEQAEATLAAETAMNLPVRPTPTRSESRPVRSGLWVVVGLAAAVCVLVAGGLSLLPVGNQPNEMTWDPADASAGSLVAIWTEESAEIAEQPATQSVISERANVDSDGNAADGDSVLMADDDSDIPGWMIAAVEEGHS